MKTLVSIFVLFFSFEIYAGKYCEMTEDESDNSISSLQTIIEEHNFNLTPEEHFLTLKCHMVYDINPDEPLEMLQKCPPGLYPSLQNEIDFQENGLVKTNNFEFQSFVVKRKNTLKEYKKYEITVDDKAIIKNLIFIHPVSYTISKIALRDFDLTKTSDCNILKEYTENADFYNYREYNESYRGLCFCEKNK